MPRKILVIEDDEAIQQLIEKKISKEFPEVDLHAVMDGVSATQEIEYNDYDLIITDMHLPRKGGDSVIKRVRYSKHNRTTPLIVITGAPQSNMRKEFAPIHLIPKPFRMKELANAVRDLLSLDKKSLKMQNESFQSILFGFEQLLDQAGAVIHDLNHPAIREQGEELKGGIHLFFDLNFGGEKVRFDLGFEKPMLYRLYEEVSGGKQLNEEDASFLMASEEFTKVLARNVKKQFELHGEDAPEFNFRGCYLTKDGADYQKAKSYRGLSLEGSTSIGKVYIQQLLVPYKSRQAA